MKKEKQLTEENIFNTLKQFTIECVHGSDFDQGNSQKDTLSILETWWNKHKNKYLKTTKQDFDDKSESTEKNDLLHDLFNKLYELLDDIKILSDAKNSALEITNTKLMQSTLPIINENTFNEAINHIQKTYCDSHFGMPYMLLGDVSELLKIITGKEINLNEMLKYHRQ
jgi:hypothetical protein